MNYLGGKRINNLKTMYRYLLIIVCLCITGEIKSSDVKKVSCTYTYYAPESMSPEEAKRIALERAKIQAIADEYGTDMSQNNSIVINTTNGDTDSQFYSFMQSAIKGEWIETIGSPKFNITFEDRCVVVECKVEGRIKELSKKIVDLEILTLRNAPNVNFNTTEFKDGDELFLFFKSPISGYLNIFLLSNDDDSAFCLLPYKRNQEGSFHVEADQEYYLFSRDKGLNNKNEIDQYTLSASSAKEFNDLIIIFSPHEFNKSNLKSAQKMTSVPRYTTLNKFHEWLSKLKTRNDDITTSTITLTISKQ